jgi:hypothetical protein
VDFRKQGDGRAVGSPRGSDDARDL